MPGRLQQWWLDRSVRAKALIVLAVPLIALIGIASASLAVQSTERNERGVATAEFNLINSANRVLADAVNGETGVRAYAATRDRQFLGPYNLALGRVRADRRAFTGAAILAGEVSQQDVVDDTAAVALAELARMRSAVGHGISPHGLTLLLLHDKATMDTLRDQVADLVQGPAAHLVARRRSITHLENAIGALDIAGFALGLAAALLGVVLFTSGISRRVATAAVNADRLGEGQPLRPVPPAKDEVGRLAKSLVRAEKVLASREAALTEARDEAVLANQAKNAFLSSTSHELRTPLNSIIGFAQLLEMSDLDAEDHDGVQRILGAGRHLLALINELIDIARIESGDLSLSLESVAVVPLIDDAAKLMEPLAAGRSVRIATECTNPALAARADRQRLSQVLVNLVSNAVKYNRVGGSITITCGDADPEWASVTVTDTGRGISPGDLERIFAPFERLGLEQNGVEGTGIGLPLAKALAEAMNGRLTVSSVVGEGSAFTVTVPRSADVVPAESEEPAESPSLPTAVPFGPGLASLNMMYIEDNPANVEVVSRFLRGRLNILLKPFPTGREGLEYATTNYPDIILLDLHLPDIHGERVLKELKADSATADIPVVILSADATQRMIKRLLTGGALAYLTKPLDLAELGRVLDSIIGSRPDQSTSPEGRSSD